MHKNTLDIDLSGKVAVVTGAGGVLCSDMARALARAGARVALLNRTGKILAATPMGRFGDSAELEGALLFLVNDKAASFITGVTLPVDGGFSAYSGV